MLVNHEPNVPSDVVDITNDPTTNEPGSVRYDVVEQSPRVTLQLLRHIAQSSLQIGN